MEAVRVLALFVLAGLAEIGGGYGLWLWLREGRPAWVGLLGAAALVFYGVLPTLQPARLDFGQVYAAYGGVFILLSLGWGWLIDGRRPDGPTILGAGVALIGTAIIIYWPRGG